MYESRGIQRIEPHRRCNISVAQLKHIKAEFKTLYSSILDVYGQVKLTITHEPSQDGLVKTIFRFPDESEKFLVSVCIDKLLPQFQACLMCAVYREKV
jgi:hypothetical protein